MKADLLAVYYFLEVHAPALVDMFLEHFSGNGSIITRFDKQFNAKVL